MWGTEKGGGRWLTSDCGGVEIVVAEAEVTPPRPTFAVQGSGIMQLTRATKGGLIWGSNRSVIKDPNRLLISGRQFYMIDHGGLLELLADEVNFVLLN